jgi:hypothetical protein
VTEVDCGGPKRSGLSGKSADWQEQNSVVMSGPSAQTHQQSASSMFPSAPLSTFKPLTIKNMQAKNHLFWWVC